MCWSLSHFGQFVLLLYLYIARHTLHMYRVIILSENYQFTGRIRETDVS